MFETSLTTTAAASGGRTNRLEALAFTTFAHLLVGSVLMANSIVNINFPVVPPRGTARFIVSIPLVPPPPPPPPPAPRNRETAVQSTRPSQVTQSITAPTVIPDEIPVLSSTAKDSVAEQFSADNAAGVEGGVEGGVAGGVVGGDLQGVAGGIVHGIVTKPVVPKGLVVIPHGAKLPMIATSQVYPVYPEGAKLRRTEGSVLVRYIVDKKGRVREVKILRHAATPNFDEAVLKAIRGWRFRPMVDKGEKVEVMHDLTVYFVLENI
ncbi:MAG TPA: energy transducer TonB [Thermoanaerobaculia bacterium]|nr:energy transducer TonB [Thermoanaerobaculia bacterium]